MNVNKSNLLILDNDLTARLATYKTQHELAIRAKMLLHSRQANAASLILANIVIVNVGNRLVIFFQHGQSI